MHLYYCSGLFQTSRSMKLGILVSKSNSSADSGTISMRAICLNIARACASNTCHFCAPTNFLAPSRYSGGTPSITSIVAVPRTNNTLGGYVLVSIVSATFGFVVSARTFGAFGAVPMMNCAQYRCWFRKL